LEFQPSKAAELGRAYFTYALTTLGGIGPPETLSFLDFVFLRSMSRELAAAGTGRDALERRDLMFAASHAALLRANSVCLCRHISSAPTGTSTHPAAARAARAALTRRLDEHRHIFAPPPSLPLPPSGPPS
jgi:hypothetical protein